jgi:hypothetical protein
MMESSSLGLNCLNVCLLSCFVGPLVGDLLVALSSFNTLSTFVMVIGYLFCMFLHEHFDVLLISPFVTMTTVRISLDGDSFYLHCLGWAKSKVWCTIYRFKLPSSTCAADRSKAAPLCVPPMYVFVVSYCYVDTFVSLVVFSSTVSIFPFAPRFYFLFFIRHTTCLVFNQFTVGHFAFLF